MNNQQLEAFAREAAKSIKTESDLNDFRQMLTKVTVETALNTERDEHLCYGKHCSSPTSNKRNGSTAKTLKTEDGRLTIESPRDRDSTFSPQLVKKRQARFASMDDKILSLYAKLLIDRVDV